VVWRLITFIFRLNHYSKPAQVPLTSFLIWRSASWHGASAWCRLNSFYTRSALTQLYGFVVPFLPSDSLMPTHRIVVGAYLCFAGRARFGLQFIRSALIIILWGWGPRTLHLLGDGSRICSHQTQSLSIFLYSNKNFSFKQLKNESEPRLLSAQIRGNPLLPYQTLSDDTVFQPSLSHESVIFLLSLLF